MSNKTTVSIPKELVFKLRQIAANLSEEEDRTVTATELVERAIRKQYKIKSKRETKKWN